MTHVAGLQQNLPAHDRVSQAAAVAQRVQASGSARGQLSEIESGEKGPSDYPFIQLVLSTCRCNFSGFHGMFQDFEVPSRPSTSDRLPGLVREAGLHLARGGGVA